MFKGRSTNLLNVLGTGVKLLIHSTLQREP